MSDYEYNKGVLIPFGCMIEERAKRIINNVGVEDLPEYYESYLEMLRDDPEKYGLAYLNGEWYQVEFSVRGGEMLDEFCNLTYLDHGEIAFSSQHYNGVAHWTEVLEDELAKGDL